MTSAQVLIPAAVAGLGLAAKVFLAARNWSRRVQLTATFRRPWYACPVAKIRLGNPRRRVVTLVRGELSVAEESGDDEYSSCSLALSNDGMNFHLPGFADRDVALSSEGLALVQSAVKANRKVVLRLWAEGFAHPTSVVLSVPREVEIKGAIPTTRA